MLTSSQSQMAWGLSFLIVMLGKQEKVMKYTAHFFGRNKGAIGISQRFIVFVVADNEDDARLKLYDTHEHISQCVFIEENENATN